MKLFDTKERKLVEFEVPKTVGMYVCGITPYDSAHLGHVFTFLTYDLIQRRLEDTGHTVRLVRNVTDVDEPIYQRAAENGELYTELAERETTQFQRLMGQLNFRKPYAEPLASAYIMQMALAVQELLGKGNAYRLAEDIYFDVCTYKSFGTFSGFSDKLLTNLMKERGGDPARPGKRNPFDFILWKGISDPKDPAAWSTEIGRGRPGWHIECSVMASELLKNPISIHGGGMDLIFPHHECEIAQSESLGSVPFSNYWLHVAPMLYSGEKMSKSLGNLVFAKDILEQHEPAAVRLAMMHYHYRTGGQWRDEFLVESGELLDRIKRAMSMEVGPDGKKLLNCVRKALDDDIDTHEILWLLKDFVSKMEHGEGDDPGAAAGLSLTLDLLGLKV